jgi:hypothetical protein
MEKIGVDRKEVCNARDIPCVVVVFGVESDVLFSIVES